ncbi:hypothetical protein [Nonomuraea dietziae]|uniref:hypothetical protein n=1 Tax=Nonomuraea dietziae TaxID=65515 RepID=UPI0031E3BEA9
MPEQHAVQAAEESQRQREEGRPAGLTREQGQPSCHDAGQRADDEPWDGQFEAVTGDHQPTTTPKATRL